MRLVDFDKTITLDVKDNDTVDNLKAKIEAKANIPAGQQNISHTGTPGFLEGGRTLSYYNLYESSRVLCVLFGPLDVD